MSNELLDLVKGAEAHHRGVRKAQALDDNKLARLEGREPDLQKASGWTPVPKTRNHGMRKRNAKGGWDYWYPDQNSYKRGKVDDEHNHSHDGRETARGDRMHIGPERHDALVVHHQNKRDEHLEGFKGDNSHHDNMLASEMAHHNAMRMASEAALRGDGAEQAAMYKLAEKNRKEAVAHHDAHWDEHHAKQAKVRKLDKKVISHHRSSRGQEVKVVAHVDKNGEAQGHSIEQSWDSAKQGTSDYAGGAHSDPTVSGHNTLESAKHHASQIMSGGSSPYDQATKWEDKTASKEHANAKYLDSLPAAKRTKILNHVANHYGVSVAEIKDEVNDPDAENLFEYTATDPVMSMEIYRDFKRQGLTKSVDDNPDLLKAGGGPFIGKRGGKWADSDHTIAWKDGKTASRQRKHAHGGTEKGWHNDHKDTTEDEHHALAKKHSKLMYEAHAKKMDARKDSNAYFAHKYESEYHGKMAEAHGAMKLGKFRYGGPEKYDVSNANHALRDARKLKQAHTEAAEAVESTKAPANKRGDTHSVGNTASGKKMAFLSQSNFRDHTVGWSEDDHKEAAAEHNARADHKWALSDQLQGEGKWEEAAKHNSAGRYHDQLSRVHEASGRDPSRLHRNLPNMERATHAAAVSTTGRLSDLPKKESKVKFKIDDHEGKLGDRLNERGARMGTHEGLEFDNVEDLNSALAGIVAADPGGGYRKTSITMTHPDGTHSARMDLDASGETKPDFERHLRTQGDNYHTPKGEEYHSAMKQYMSHPTAKETGDYYHQMADHAAGAVKKSIVVQDQDMSKSKTFKSETKHSNMNMEYAPHIRAMYAGGDK